MSSTKRIIALCAALGAAPWPSAWAVSPVSREPIEITADAAEHDEAKRMVTYSGNVIAVQGPFTLRSDTLTHHQPENGPQLLIAEGAPVRIHQEPYEDREEVDASASRAEYDMDADLVTLIGDAELIQKGDRVTSDRIVYELEKSVVRAGTAASGSQRVHTVIQPRK